MPLRALTAASLPLALILLATLAAPPAADAQVKNPFSPNRVHPDGAVIMIAGVITDRNGDPLENVEVVLEGARNEIKWGRFKREKENAVTVSTRTDERGEYTLNWSWHHYYDTFELRVVAPQIPGEDEQSRVLASLDVSERMRSRSTPVVASLSIQDTSRLEAWRSFLASIDSVDKRRVFDDHGRPDKIETTRLPEGEEVSWWYFERGETYRFRNGALQRVDDFDPVEGFGGR